MKGRDPSLSKQDLLLYDFKRGYVRVSFVSPLSRNDQFRSVFKEPDQKLPQADVLLERIQESSGQITEPVTDAINEALKCVKDTEDAFVPVAEALLKLLTSSGNQIPLA